MAFKCLKLIMAVIGSHQELIPAQLPKEAIEATR